MFDTCYSTFGLICCRPEFLPTCRQVWWLPSSVPVLCKLGSRGKSFETSPKYCKTKKSLVRNKPPVLGTPSRKQWAFKMLVIKHVLERKTTRTGKSLVEPVHWEKMDRNVFILQKYRTTQMSFDTFEQSSLNAGYVQQC